MSPKRSGIGGKPPGTLSVGAAWFDYDNDGLLDLVVSNYTLWTPETDKRCARRAWNITAIRGSSIRPCRIGSITTSGDGKFEDVTEKSGIGAAPGKGMGISIADFNGDGWQDVFIANDTEANSLFINKGDGTFEDQGLQLGVAYDETAKAVSSMGSRRERLQQRRQGGHLLQQPDGPVLGAVPEHAATPSATSRRKRKSSSSARLIPDGAPASSISTMTDGRICTPRTATSTTTSPLRASTTPCSRTWTASSSPMFRPAWGRTFCAWAISVARRSAI